MSWPFFIGWVLASLIGYAIGFPVGLAVGKSLLWGWVIGGGLATLVQWLLLRHRLTRAGWWIGLSLVGLLTGAGLSFVVSQYALDVAGLTAAFAATGATVGVAVGLTQWTMLRLQVRQAGWWTLASAAGYTLGVLAAVNNPLVIPVRLGTVFGPEFGGLVGAISGAITGAVMLWLLRRSVSRNQHDSGSGGLTKGWTP